MAKINAIGNATGSLTVNPGAKGPVLMELEEGTVIHDIYLYNPAVIYVDHVPDKDNKEDNGENK